MLLNSVSVLGGKPPKRFLYRFNPKSLRKKLLAGPNAHFPLFCRKYCMFLHHGITEHHYPTSLTATPHPDHRPWTLPIILNFHASHRSNSENPIGPKNAQIFPSPEMPFHSNILWFWCFTSPLLAQDSKSEKVKIFNSRDGDGVGAPTINQKNIDEQTSMMDRQ